MILSEAVLYPLLFKPSLEGKWKQFINIKICSGIIFKQKKRAESMFQKGKVWKYSLAFKKIFTLAALVLFCDFAKMNILANKFISKVKKKKKPQKVTENELLIWKNKISDSKGH